MKQMPANIESLFDVRQAPWHGLGIRVEEALNSEDALTTAGLNWQVNQTPIFTPNGQQIPNYKANIRDTDNQILGVVSDRYQIVQNEEAFAFTDALLGEGVRYDDEQRGFPLPDGIKPHFVVAHNLPKLGNIERSEPRTARNEYAFRRFACSSLSRIFYTIKK